RHRAPRAVLSLPTRRSSDLVTTFSHDAAGNRTAEITPSDSTLYAWDAAGRMESADVDTGVISFTYNADGQRVLKEAADGPTGFLYDQQRILHETDDIGGDISTTYATSTTDEFGDLL